MPEPLDELLRKAAKIKMSPEDKEAQRQSFAYGNAHIENERVTREMVKDAAARVSK